MVGHYNKQNPSSEAKPLERVAFLVLSGSCGLPQENDQSGGVRCITNGSDDGRNLCAVMCSMMKHMGNDPRNRCFDRPRLWWWYK